MIKTLHADTVKQLAEAINKRNITKNEILNIIKMEDQFVVFYEKEY